MVNEPANYIWSSYQINGLGKKSSLCEPHEVYLGIGRTKEERLNCYRRLFHNHIDGKLLTDILEAVNKSMALGNDKFKEEIELLSGRRVKEGKRGRPVGWRKNEK